LEVGAGVARSVATPGGERMAIFSRSIPMKAERKGFAGRVDTSGGMAVVKLRDLGGGRMRLTARGKGADVRALDTGSRDLTVALEVRLAGSPRRASLVKTRILGGKRRVFRLAGGGRG